MGEHTSPGKRQQLAPRPNLELYLAIPVNCDESLTEEDWKAETERMFQHSRITQQFINGEISPADYECWIAESGFDPYDLGELWDDGKSLLLP